jgi:hypothetical protein
MEKAGTVHSPSESGVALVLALVITTVMLLLIAGVSYLFTTGYQVNVINRQFSTAYDAANGGVEYVAGIINTCLKKNEAPPDIGSVSPDTATLNTMVTTCSNTTATIMAKTADGKFTLTVAINCLGTKPIPGYGGALRFPPPPGAIGGGATTTATKYLMYRIVAKATESVNSQNVGQTEVVYRAMQ